MARFLDLKREILYQDLKCPKEIRIPTNDIQAWTQYPEHNWVYNKMLIAKSQNVEHGPVGVVPKKFPIIEKPIINLFGMGINAVKYSSLKEYNKSRNVGGLFWSEFFKGEHLSIDLIVIKGEVKWSCIFRGYKNKGKVGSFNFWESLPDKKLSNYIKFWIDKYLKDYVGCVNLETIGGRIIECHLRMGDLKYIDTKDNRVFKEVIKLYTTGEWELNMRVRKMYLVPVFFSPEEYAKLEIKKLNREFLKSYCTKHRIEYIESDPVDSFGNPEDGIRCYLFGGTNLYLMLKCRDDVRKFIMDYRKREFNVSVFGIEFSFTY